MSILSWGMSLLIVLWGYGPTVGETATQTEVVPPSSVSLRDTELGRLAQSLQPGEFKVLDEKVDGASNLSRLLRVPAGDGKRQLAIDAWADGGYWDPRRQRTFFLGHRYRKKFISYWAADNTWREIPCWDVKPAPSQIEKFGHPYGRITYDWRRGHYYHLAKDGWWRYWVDENRWEQLPGTVGGYVPIAWHEGLQALIVVSDNQFRAFDGKAWRVLGDSAVNGYHSSARYNEVRGDLLTLGGNHSMQKVDLLTATGEIRHVQDAPFKFSISSDNLTYDPSSGHYLVLKWDEKELWEYSPDQDEWRLAMRWDRKTWPFNSYGGVVPYPIDELGVILWQYGPGTRVYRHQSVFESKSEAVSSPPSATKSKLVAIGATLQPGEWRYVDTDLGGASKLSQVLTIEFCPLGSGRGTHGNGWMDSFVYDPESQSFWVLMMRDRSDKRLAWLDADLRWHVVRNPWGEDCSTNRRPFNRLSLVNGMLYWPPAYWGEERKKMGTFRRAPVAPYLRGETSVTWEEYGVGWGQTSAGQNGDFAVEWFPEFGGWIMHVPGRTTAIDKGWPSREGHTEEGAAQGKQWNGRLFYFRPGDSQWTYLDRTYSQGYRSRLLYNPIKGEMLLGPGGTFDKQPITAEFTRILADGIVQKLDQAVGASLKYHTGSDNLTYCPSTGDYLWWSYKDRMMWRSGDGQHWQVYEDFLGIGNSPLFPKGRQKFAGREGLFGASSFIQVNPIPNTDLLVWFDPHRGVILHRMRPQ
ncbi:MAG: hypothetical protein KDI50_01885 [Candidatus Competibacteraceae bacterium]|nr:hypothetical protein [Candidatus Competibacteraceae bacterium]